MFLLGGLNEYLEFQRESSQLRQSLEDTAAQQSQAVLLTIREPVLSGRWDEVRLRFRQLANLFPQTHMMLVRPDGSLLVTSDGAAPLSPNEQANWDSAVQVSWPKPEKLLRVSAPIMNSRRETVAILITETDQQVQFDHLNSSRLSHTIPFLLIFLFMLGLFLLVLIVLLVRPLNQIYRLSRAVSQGQYEGRAQSWPVLELEYISLAFNEMLDHMASQSSTLQKLNQELAQKVAEKTSALQASNKAIRNRAVQLEAINTLIGSTAGVLNMPELVQTVIDQTIQALQTSHGCLQILGARAYSHLTEETAQILFESAYGVRYLPVEKLLVENWHEVPSAHILAPVGPIMLAQNIRSSIVLPIFVNNEPSGMLFLADSQIRSWKAEDVALLEIIIHHLGTAAARTQSVEKIRTHNLLMGGLISQSEDLNRTFTFKEVIAKIGEGSLQLSKADRLAIFAQGEDQILFCAWSHNLPEPYIQAAVQDAGQFALLSGDGSTDLVFDYMPPETSLDSQLRWIAQQEGIHTVTAWPLVFENQSNAIVYCFYNQPAVWTYDEQDILQAFFRQAAAALENARLFEAEREQRLLAEALRETSATLNSTLDLDEVLDGILNNLCRVVPHDAAGIMLLDGEMIYPARWHGLTEANAERFKNWRFPIHLLKNRQRMVETVQAVVIPDTSQDPGWVRTVGLEWVMSYAGAPICQRGEVTGFIDVMSGQPGFFSARVGPLLQAFANQSAVALENARLYHHTQQRMDETRALYRAIQPLFGSVSEMAVLARQITKAVTQEFASAHCSILLVNENRTQLHLVAQSGSIHLNAPDMLLNGQGLTVKAVKTKKMVYSPDVTKDPNYVAGGDQSRSELAIPLFAGGEVIGILNMESPEVDAFDERGRNLLASFAEQAALGLENAHLFATIRQNVKQMAQLSGLAQRRAQEAENLRLATAAISSTLDLQTVLDSILNHIEQVVPHDSACMFLIENDKELRVWAAKNITRKEEALNHVFPRSNELFHEIERSRRAVPLTDAAADPRFIGWGGTEHIHCWMGVPMIAAKEFVGILTLDRLQQHEFSQEEMELAQAFANQAAIAVQNARLYQSSQQHARELEALHIATTSLVTTLDIEKLLERILQSSINAIPAARSAALHMLEPDGRLKLRIQHGLDSIDDQNACWNSEKSPWQWALQNQKPLVIDQTRPDENRVFDLPETWETYSLLIAPLVQEDKVLGMLSLISADPAAFTEQDLHLLISFASTATTAIHNANLHSAVQYLAITDPLTNVYNRRGFFELAQRLVIQAVTFNRPVSAIMVDIDYFKLVNDQFGHDIGDVVLQKLSRRCKNALRDSDLICRYGGEEFAIMLAESDTAGALRAANRLFGNISGIPIQTDAGPVTVTISVGVATFSKDCSTLDLLLKNADRALHRAKQAGRNQIQVWSE